MINYVEIFYRGKPNYGRLNKNKIDSNYLLYLNVSNINFVV